MNAYAEPVVSLDLDLAIAKEQISDVERWLRERSRFAGFRTA